MVWTFSVKVLFTGYVKTLKTLISPPNTDCSFHRLRPQTELKIILTLASPLLLLNTKQRVQGRVESLVERGGWKVQVLERRDLNGAFHCITYFTYLHISISRNIVYFTFDYYY